MSKMLLILLVVTAVLAVETNATEVQVCGTGATDTTSLQFSDCNAKRCDFPRGATASVTIRFTPTTTIHSLTTDVTETVRGTKRFTNTVLNGLDACDSILRTCDNSTVKCPLSPGVQYAYVLEGPISKNKPTGDARIRWALKQGTTTVVCFEKDVRVV